MIKILAACGSGMGSSMMIKMKIEKAMREAGITDFKVDYSSVSESKSLASQYDIVVAANGLIHQLDGRTKGTLIGLNNLMDDQEIKDKILPVIQQHEAG